MKIALAVLLGCAVCAALLLWQHRTVMPAHTKTVSVGTTTVAVEVADTEPARELGLGGRDSLAPGHGMLFVFDAPGSWGIWMKDMRFPIDIVWARGDGTVTAVARGISPATYPEVFYPPAPDALFVLELPAGGAASLAEGSKIVVQ